MRREQLGAPTQLRSQLRKLASPLIVHVALHCFAYSKIASEFTSVSGIEAARESTHTIIDNASAGVSTSCSRGRRAKIKEQTGR